MHTFWKLLDKMEQKNDDTIFTNNISEERWLAHFKHISQSPYGKFSLPKNTSKEGNLDYEISNEEIQLGSYILRNNKSPGYDSISNEMISCLLIVKPEILRKIFNAILNNPVTIERWNTSLIFPLHKKGQKQTPITIGVFPFCLAFRNFFSQFLTRG